MHMYLGEFTLSVSQHTDLEQSEWDKIKYMFIVPHIQDSSSKETLSYFAKMFIYPYITQKL